MEELYTKDAFGNQLEVGDTVVAATTLIQSPAIKKGVILSMSGKPYEVIDVNNGEREVHLIAKWRIKWTQYPKWTFDRLKICESTVHGLNLMKYNES